MSFSAYWSGQTLPPENCINVQGNLGNRIHLINVNEENSVLKITMIFTFHLSICMCDSHFIACITLLPLTISQLLNLLSWSQKTKFALCLSCCLPFHKDDLKNMHPTFMHCMIKSWPRFHLHHKNVLREHNRPIELTCTFHRSLTEAAAARPGVFSQGALCDGALPPSTADL